MAARYWILTIPHAQFTPYHVPGVDWLKGQLECGAQDGYLHWQLVISFPRAYRLAGLKKLFGNALHAEPTRSDAADAYVHKEDTAVAGTKFEFGFKTSRRNRVRDWDAVWESAKRGELLDIPSDIRIRCYSTLQRISKDHLQPVAMERDVQVFWGRTGSGKSRLAWERAGLGAYPKDPRTKFWDGYSGHSNVIIDEFRGGIDISHLLRWFDRYPVIVDVKFGATVLRAERIWVTSNLDPRKWYPDLDPETLDALLRRLNITYFPCLFLSFLY
nr:MAG: replication associated protein [Cressdnaviricota sp.]